MARVLILEWSRRAQDDLNRFAIFLSERHPSLSARIVDALLQKAVDLELFPELGRADEVDLALREVVFKVLNAHYVLQYR